MFAIMEEKNLQTIYIGTLKECHTIMLESGCYKWDINSAGRLYYTSCGKFLVVKRG